MSVEKLLSHYGFFRIKTATPLIRKQKNDLFKEHLRTLISSCESRVIIGDSIVSGLFQYSDVKTNLLGNFINLGVSGDKIQHVLWRAENLEFPCSIKEVTIVCGTNNLEECTTIDISNGIICIALVLVMRNPSIKVFINGLLPRNEHDSSFRDKIKSVNLHLQNSCRDINEEKEIDIFYIHPEPDWTLSNGLLDSNLFWKDQLHLSKNGNIKLARSILKNIASTKKLPSKYETPSSNILVNDIAFPCLTSQSSLYVSPCPVPCEKSYASVL